MTTKVGGIVIDIDARLTKLEASIEKGRREMRRFARDSRSSASAVERSLAGIGAGFGSLKAAAAGFLSVATVRGLANLADASKNLEAQLRLATATSGSFATAQADVRRIADQTRSGLEETAQLYAAFQRNSTDLGLSQEQVARITQTVSESFKVSGSSAEESAQGTRQLVQAFQSGVLRGDEFNSIMENAPRLARLLADSLGVPIGQLRAMAEAGELTADKLSRAFSDARFTATLDAEFQELPVTFDQAMTQLKNSALTTFGAFDRGGEFSTDLANFFNQSAEGFGQMERDAADAGAYIRSVFDGLDHVFDPMGDNAANVFSLIHDFTRDASNDLAALMRAYDDLSHNYPRFGMATTIAIRKGRLPAPDDFQDTGGEYEREQRAAYRARSHRLALDRVAQALGGQNVQVVGDQEIGHFDPFGRRPPEQSSRSHGGSSAGAASRRTGGSGGGHASDGEAALRRAQAEQQRFQDELARLNQDFLAARARQTNSAQDEADLEIAQITAERDRQDAAFRAAAELTRGDHMIADARAKELIEANRRVAAEHIRGVKIEAQDRIDRERFDAARADLSNAIDLEQANGALADTYADRRASALRLLELEKRQERLQLEAVTHSKTASDAEKQIAQARLDMLDSIYNARSQGAVLSNLGPMASFLDQLPTTAARANEALERVASEGLQSISDGLADAIVGARSLSDVFKNVTRSIIADLLRIQIQKSIIAPLAGALGGMFGGGKTGGVNAPWFVGGGGALLQGHALGGYTRPGWALVGERGPEVVEFGGPATITPNHRLGAVNDNLAAGGGGITFDLRGAVMTEDLLRQMQAMSDQAAVRGAVGGRALTVDHLGRKARRRMGR